MGIICSPNYLIDSWFDWWLLDWWLFDWWVDLLVCSIHSFCLVHSISLCNFVKLRLLQNYFLIGCKPCLIWFELFIIISSLFSTNSNLFHTHFYEIAKRDRMDKPMERTERDGIERNEQNELINPSSKKSPIKQSSHESIK